LEFVLEFVEGIVLEPIGEACTAGHRGNWGAPQNDTMTVPMQSPDYASIAKVFPIIAQMWVSKVSISRLS